MTEKLFDLDSPRLLQNLEGAETTLGKILHNQNGYMSPNEIILATIVMDLIDYVLRTEKGISL